MNSICISLIFYEFPIFFLEFNMNLLYLSRIYYEFTFFREFIMLPFSVYLGVTRIHSEFIFGFANSLAISRKYHELIICFTMKSLSISWVQYVFIIYFANSLWINYLFREVTKNFFLFREFIVNSLFYFANSLFFIELYA